MQIYWNKENFWHRKRVQLPQDWFGTQTYPPFYCFGTPLWPLWRHVETFYTICVKFGIGHPCYWQLTAVKKLSADQCHTTASRAQEYNSWRWRSFEIIRWPSAGSGPFLKGGIQFAFCLRQKMNFSRKTFLKTFLERSFLAFGLS